MLIDLFHWIDIDAMTTDNDTTLYLILENQKSENIIG